MFKKILLGISGMVIVIAAGSQPILAADTTFTQKILPMDCVFETVNDGTGTLYYVTPEACGVVVNQPPEQATITPYVTNPSGGTIGAAPTPYYSIAPFRVLDLGQLPSSTSGKQAENFRAVIDQTYSFTINVRDPKNPNRIFSSRHFLTLMSTDMSDTWHPAATLLLRSSPTTVSLKKDQIILRDLNDDGSLDFGIKAEDINASSAELNIWQTSPQPNLPNSTWSSAAKQRSKKLWYLASAVVMALAVYEFCRRRVIRKALRTKTKLPW